MLLLRLGHGLPILLALALLNTVSSARAQKAQWSSDDYKRYDYERFLAGSLADQPIEAGSIDYPLLNAALFYATNEQRAAHKRPLFKHSPACERAAFGHSRDMVQHQFFSHTSVVKGKEYFGQRMAMEGISGGSRAENIFNKYGYVPITYAEFARKTVKGWMESPGHRDNILNRAYRYLGCGAYYHEARSTNRFLRFMCTQNFSSQPAQP
jgi:uncharacterized protein YkwD